MVKKSGRYSHRSLYKTVDSEVEITFDDVMEYIEDYATADELKEIAEFMKEEPLSEMKEDSGFDGSYIAEEKRTLLTGAAKKFTLQELEEKLGGNKFDFM